MGGLAAFRRSVGLNAAAVRGIYMRKTIMSVSSHHCYREERREEEKKIAHKNETYPTDDSWKNHVGKSCNQDLFKRAKQNTR